MIEVNVNNISKSFGADLIFENISFDIKTNERIGLIGPNGSGKTTIIKILYNLENIQEGSISFRKGIKLGYLDQIPDYEDDVTVIDILEMSFSDLHEIKKRMDTLSESFSHLTEIDLEKALKEYARLTEEFEQLDGYNIETNINKVCTGLRINEHMKSNVFNNLSGGEKTRITLARILLEEPNVLMLDEPTNHLDLESIEWLESYLKNYKGSVLIVSHDRYFLDNVCEKLVELSTHKAHIYHGNYSYYVIEKERRFLLELKAYLSQQKQIKRMEEQIKRYRIWGVMRDSDKMFKRAKELERRLEKVERLDKPRTLDKMKLSKLQSARSGKRVLEATNINKSFGSLHLLKNAHLELFYQDNLAILGNNGTGKTTLLKLLMDDYIKEEPIYKWGSKLKLGYLEQEVSFEEENITLLYYFMNTHNVNQGVARKELAKALFIRDDVNKKIKVLSGGEKSKLKLCSLTYNQTNFLILDEPTNHLDIDSREILEEMLEEFNGTILFISHDRYFIKKIANRIGEIENQEVHYYEGDYDYFRQIKLKNSVEEKTVKVKRQKRVKPKREKMVDYYKELELLEEKINNIDQLMEEFGYDLDKLQELHEKKEELEKEYHDIFHMIED